jgi:hypothetical protein
VRQQNDRPPLRELLAGGGPGRGILTLGLTPPRRSATPGQVKEIAAATLARLAPLDVDGVILYDIDDESDRTDAERPFPYLPTMDPAVFQADYLSELEHPAIIYRATGKYGEAELREWLGAGPDPGATVFVGASSREKTVRTTLARAHELRSQLRPDLPVGGVVITERYKQRRDEHRRMLAKQERGVTFFVSQVVYDADATKSLLSDYFYAAAEQGTPVRPVIFTLSVCGSLRTLAFLQWLGVDVPRWLENSLVHSPDPLARSYAHCLAVAEQLIEFCEDLGVPYGFNVESVSIRRVEIEAAVELATRVRELLDAR